MPSRQGVLSFSSTWPASVELHSLVCQRRPGDGAAQLLQPLALVRFDPHGRVQFVVAGRTGLDEHRHAIGAAPVHPVQHQAVQVNVQE